MSLKKGCGIRIFQKVAPSYSFFAITKGALKRMSNFSNFSTKLLSFTRTISAASQAITRQLSYRATSEKRNFYSLQKKGSDLQPECYHFLCRLMDKFLNATTLYAFGFAKWLKCIDFLSRKSSLCSHFRIAGIAAILDQRVQYKNTLSKRCLPCHHSFFLQNQRQKQRRNLESLTHFKANFDGFSSGIQWHHHYRYTSRTLRKRQVETLKVKWPLMPR